DRRHDETLREEPHIDGGSRPACGGRGWRCELLTRIHQRGQRGQKLHRRHECGSRCPRRELLAQKDQRRQGHQKLHRRSEPHPVADTGTIASQYERKQPCGAKAQGRLPQMVERGEHHVDVPRFGLSRTIRSASWISSSVSLPVSIRVAISGSVRPPNISRKWWTRFRCAVLREIVASNM